MEVRGRLLELLLSFHCVGIFHVSVWGEVVLGVNQLRQPDQALC